MQVLSFQAFKDEFPQNRPSETRQKTEAAVDEKVGTISDEVRRSLGKLLSSVGQGEQQSVYLKEAAQIAGIKYGASKNRLKHFLSGGGTANLFWAFYYLMHLKHPYLSQLQEIDRKLLSRQTFQEARGRPVALLDNQKTLPEIDPLTIQLDQPHTLHFGTERPAAPSGPILGFPEPEFAQGSSVSDDRINWLNPLAVDSLEFVGRDDEINRLNDFCDATKPFLAWGITGPSGAGKTRLVTEWMRQIRTRHSKTGAPDKPWDIGFLTTDNLREWREQHGGDWATWLPDRPTIIVVDYLHTLSGDVVALLQRGRQLRTTDDEKRAPVRLLLIDHILPDNIHDLLRDARFSEFSTGGAIDDQGEDIFFSELPLRLHKRQQPARLLYRILHGAISLHGGQLDWREELKVLREMQELKGAWCPLFVALRGRFLAEDRSAKFNDRRDLIKHYLRSSRRLQWFSSDTETREHGLWAGCFVAIATLTGGISFEELAKALPDHLKQEKKAYDYVKSLCRWTVSGRNKEMLEPFQPDIIGETYVLLFWEQIQDGDAVSEEIKSVFLSILCGYENGERYDSSIEYVVGFIKRLTRNLLIEDHNSNQTRDLWALFFSLFRPERFRSAALPVRQAIAVSLIDFAKESKVKMNISNDGVFSKRLNGALNGILIDDISDFSYEKLSYRALVAFIRLHDYRKNAGIVDDDEIIINALESFASLLQRRNGERITGFQLACEIGADVAVEAFLARGDIGLNEPAEFGLTPLFLASQNGHAEVVRLLLRQKGINVNKSSDRRETPLWAACYKERDEVVGILLTRSEVSVNAADSNGTTPLIMAVQRRHIGISRRLISDKRTDLNARSQPYGTSALIMACNKNDERIARILIESEHIDVNLPNFDRETPLMMAAYFNNIGIVQKLLDKPGIEINAQEVGGDTALDIAIREGNLKVIALLKERFAKTRVELSPSAKQKASHLSEESSIE